jgi:hypothetical protein
MQSDVAVDSLGNVLHVTRTTSTGCATTGAFDESYNGSGDWLVTKLGPTGSVLWSTYLGGTGDEQLEKNHIGVDVSGNVFVAGTTHSTNFPTTVGAYDRSYNGGGGTGTGAGTNYSGDVAITKFSPDGALMTSTFLGGSLGDGIEGISVVSDGSVWLTGATYSTNFPVTIDAHQAIKGGGADCFITRLSVNLTTVLYSTYLGGSSEDYGRAAHYPFFGGQSSSTNFPVLLAIQPTYNGGIDAILWKF